MSSVRDLMPCLAITERNRTETVNDPFSWAALAAIRSVVTPNLFFRTVNNHTYPLLADKTIIKDFKILFKPLILRCLQHLATGAGFIPVLPTADKIQSKYHAAARTGINPIPTEDACNTLIINALPT